MKHGLNENGNTLIEKLKPAKVVRDGFHLLSMPSTYPLLWKDF